MTTKQSSSWTLVFAVGYSCVKTDSDPAAGGEVVEPGAGGGVADSDPAPGGEVVEPGAGGGVADLDPAAGGEAEAGVANRLGTTKCFCH